MVSLALEAEVSDKSIIAAASKEPSKRDEAAEQDRLGAVSVERVAKRFCEQSPEYKINDRIWRSPIQADAGHRRR